MATDTNGLYRVEYVPPGDYTIDVRSAAGDTATRPLVVGVGRDTQVDVLLGLSVSEALTVTAFTPRVDTRSTEVGFNVQADALRRLPLERTYRGLFQLIPGVAENRSLVGPAAGGSRQDNTYLMDGANIGNPTFGYLGTDVSDNLSRIATTEWAYFMTPLRAINVRYLQTNERNHDVPVTALGFLPAFDPARLTAMGQYTDPGDLPRDGRLRWTFHEAEGLAHAVVRKYFQIGRLLESDSQCHLERRTEERLIGGVHEIREHDRVALCQRRYSAREEDPRPDDDEHRRRDRGDWSP